MNVNLKYKCVQYIEKLATLQRNRFSPMNVYLLACFPMSQCPVYTAVILAMWMRLLDRKSPKWEIYGYLHPPNILPALEWKCEKTTKPRVVCTSTEIISLRDKPLLAGSSMFLRPGIQIREIQSRRLSLTSSLLHCWTTLVFIIGEFSALTFSKNPK